MTRDQAEARRRQLTAEDPDRETHDWLVQPARDGSFRLAKIRRPPGMRRGPLTESTIAEERPPEAGDPRPNAFRNIPPFGGA